MANGTGGSITINANVGNVLNPYGTGITTKGFMNTTHGPITMYSTGCISSWAQTQAGNSGAISITGRNVLLLNTSCIITGTGDITILGNNTNYPSALPYFNQQCQSFAGVYFWNPNVTTGGGNIAITGRGASIASYFADRYGI